MILTDPAGALKAQPLEHGEGAVVQKRAGGGGGAACGSFRVAFDGAAARVNAALEGALAACLTRHNQSALNEIL
jgi:hypothetical protein